MKTHLPNQPTQVYFIRHGEVEEKYHRVFGGSRIDMGLSPLGKQHGEAIDTWLADTPLSAVYASPMLRVRQTMAPLIERRGITPTFLPDLREVDFGDWTGHTWTGIQDAFGVSAFDWLEVMGDGKIPNGETADQLIERVKPCLTRVLHDNPHGRAAIFCHGGIIRTMLAILLDLPLAKTAHFNIEYGSISLVEIQPEKKHAVEIELLNWTPPVQGHSNSK